MREKELFSQTMIEFFAPIENQRYILKAQEKVSDQTEYFAVPSLFDKRKEDAQAFVAQIRRVWASMTSSIPEVPKAVPFS